MPLGTEKINESKLSIVNKLVQTSTDWKYVILTDYKLAKTSPKHAQ